MKTENLQYLLDSNHYQRQLIRLGNAGLRYVSAVDEEGCEPLYKGFATLAEAKAAADADEQAHPEYAMTVLELKQDEEGDWMCDYKNAR